MTPDEIQTIANHAKMMIPKFSNMVAGQATRSLGSEDCMATEMSYYDGTKIEHASLDAFLMSFMWMNESLNLKGFFDALDFSSECTAMGGEVYEVDIKMGCKEEKFLKDFKLCKPPICNEFEFILTKSFMASLFAPYLGCESLEVISDKVPSFECLMDFQVMYNSTELGNYSPFDFFDEGIEYIEKETDACQGKYTKRMDMKVCNMETAMKKEGNEVFLDLCQDAGGEPYPIDIVMGFPGYHRTFRKFPFCKPDSCTRFDIKLFFDYIGSIFMGDEDGEQSGKIEFKESISSSCYETPNSEAAIKQKKGKVVAKTCQWLKNRPKKMKKKICDKKKGSGGYGSAREVCPSTCCACVEDGDNVFLKKFSIGNDDSLRIQSKDCTWLQNASKNVQKSQCKKVNKFYVGGYPSAYVACPKTCGGCSL